ncbi:hypothetical protein ILUMI_09990, partial [Ignelater luminosus]
IIRPHAVVLNLSAFALHPLPQFTLTSKYTNLATTILKTYTTTEDCRLKATKKVKRPASLVSPIIHTDEWACTPQEKVDTFAIHLSKVIQPVAAALDHAQDNIPEYPDIPSAQQPESPWVTVLLGKFYPLQLKDGVLWLFQTPITGVKESLEKLQKCGKHIQFVSNHIGLSTEMFKKRLPDFKVNSEDLIYPTLAMIDYLKFINFNREIFVIGESEMKNDLKAAGFDLAEPPGGFEEGPEHVKKLIQSNERIGAVVFDVDLTLNYVMLYKAALCLKRSDVLFLVGAADKKLPVGPDMFLIGPAYFLKLLQDFTGREPFVFGKPGLHLSKYLSKKFTKDSSRTLFVGDALESDMKFASLCGYQKMLVLTGATKIEDMLTCEDKERIPDYYLSSLGNLSVIWFAQTPITGVEESLIKLQECKKRIQFVSNNTNVNLGVFQERLPNFKVTLEDIIHPTLAIIDYLKSINFNKEILVISANAMKNELKAAGFDLAEPSDSFKEDHGVANNFTESNERIGAVVCDVDLTLNYATLYNAALCLKRPDVLFIAGCADKKLPVRPNVFLIGPAYFLKILQDFTGRDPLVFGKPGLHLSKYLSKKFTKDSSRTLF